VDWFVWRPIVAQIATLEEIERSWSIDDMLDAHEALDIKFEQEEHANRGK